MDFYKAYFYYNAVLGDDKPSSHNAGESYSIFFKPLLWYKCLFALCVSAIKHTKLMISLFKTGGYKKALKILFSSTKQIFPLVVVLLMCVISTVLTLGLTFIIAIIAITWYDKLF